MTTNPPAQATPAIRTAPVRVAPAALERFGQALLMARGMREADAACVASTLVWADLHGIASHGSALFPVYLKWIAAGDMNPTAAPTFSAREPSRFTLDGNHCLGAVAMTQAADTAVEIARASGICVGTIRDTTHTGAIGRYGARIAEQGCAALALVAGPPLMAYHGARVSSASTSPVMFALPGADGEPVVFDMATSLVSFRRLQQARASGEALPEGSAIDAEGVVTTDAARARIPLPIAGPKGSGLSVMIEMLVSLVAGNPLVTDHLRPEGARRHSQNALLLVMDVAAFRPLDAFRHDIGQLISTLKGLPLAAGFSEIRMPGERGARLAAERATDGIPIPPPVHAEMRSAAAELGVELPAGLA
jgi:ureidoglycolate dehydrogenase (NAD+)